MDELDQVILDAQKVLNIRRDRAVLGIQEGTSAGQIYVPYQPGFLWVCEYEAGGFSSPKAVRKGPNAAFPMKPGLGVVLGYDDQGERCILHADDSAITQSGGNPLTLNPFDPSMQFFTQDGLITGRVTPDNPDTTLYCLVKGWIFYDRRTVRRFGGERVNLTSFVPSSGNHRLAGVFMLADGSACEVKASTAKSALSPLTITGDLQECLTAASTGSTPLWFWRLYGGQTAIKANDTFLDGRGLLNVGMGDTKRGVRVVTAAGDVTVTKADDVVIVNKASGAATAVNLPASPATGLQFVVKDGKFDCNSNNITLTPASGNINNAPTYVMNVNGQSTTIVYSGTEWLVI